MGLYLSGSEFCGVVFRDCDLSGANLSHSKLHNVGFINCRLHNANLSNSSFSESYLNSCKAIETNFSNSKFFGSDFSGTVIDKANFDGCSYKSTNFVRAKLADTSILKKPFCTFLSPIASIGIFNNEISVGAHILPISKWLKASEQDLMRITGDRQLISFWQENKDWVLKMAQTMY